jgi:hypothetical protein
MNNPCNEEATNTSELEQTIFENDAQVKSDTIDPLEENDDCVDDAEMKFIRKKVVLKKKVTISPLTFNRKAETSLSSLNIRGLTESDLYLRKLDNNMLNPSLSASLPTPVLDKPEVFNIDNSDWSLYDNDKNDDTYNVQIYKQTSL